MIRKEIFFFFLKNVHRYRLSLFKACELMVFLFGCGLTSGENAVITLKYSFSYTGFLLTKGRRLLTFERHNVVTTS